MQMHQVKYFLALAAELNFTRAAERCHVSQPALTQAIRSLEDEFGGPLIVRERRHTHAIPNGFHNRLGWRGPRPLGACRLS